MIKTSIFLRLFFPLKFQEQEKNVSDDISLLENHEKDLDGDVRLLDQSKFPILLFFSAGVLYIFACTYTACILHVYLHIDLSGGEIYLKIN